MTLTEILGKRAALVKEGRALLDKAETESREFTAEEDAQYERIMADVDKMRAEVDKAKREERQAKLDGVEEELERSIDEPIKPEPESREAVNSEEYRKAFSGYLGAIDRGSESAALAELRALQMDSDIAGGYTVAPQQFIAKLIQAADDMVFVRQLATKFQVPKAESMGAPALDNDPADPTWTAEILTGDEDSTMSFGKRELYPHPLAQRIKLSKKLVRASALPIEDIVRQRLTYKTSVVEENAFLNGDGANEPMGVFVAGTDHGITTGRDVSTGNTATAIGTDGLIEAKYSLKGNYWKSCRWIFHRDALKNIRKLKDGEGQYVWSPGIVADANDTILQRPVIMSEYAPNTFTTGLYVGILGDFSYYWIADALDMQIQVLVELYAATNQNGYILRKETDGMPVLEEAFARVALA